MKTGCIQLFLITLSLSGCLADLEICGVTHTELVCDCPDNTQGLRICIDEDGPGPCDCSSAATEGVRLNELYCHGPDWIELANNSHDVVDISGWSISDKEDGDGGYRLDMGVSLSPGEHQFVSRESVTSSGFSFGLGCGRDEIYLFDDSNRIIDRVFIGNVPEEQSFGRIPDLSGDWMEATPTPGTTNWYSITAEELFDVNEIYVIDLWLNEESMSLLETDPFTYVEGELAFPRTGIPAIQVAVRLKGLHGSYRPLNEKAAFKIDLNYYNSEQEVFGLERLTLNNLVQDPSGLHEFASYSLFNAMGVPAPRMGFVWLRLNDEEIGLYANVESIDDVFLARHYETTQHLYEGAYGVDLRIEDVESFDIDEGTASFTDLEALITLLDGSLPYEFYNASQSLVDWYEVTSMLASESFMGHWDGYAYAQNNYYLHFDATSNLSLLPWGTDQTFVEALDLYEGSGLLKDRCLQSAECTDLYSQALLRISEQASALLESGQLEAMTERFQPYHEIDNRREYSLAEIEQAQIELFQYLENRVSLVSP